MKFLLRLAVVAILGLFIVLALLFFFRNDLIESAVEESGNFAFGVSTPLEEVRTDLGSGDFALVDYRIENPPGFSAEPVFALGNASMNLPLMSLQGDGALTIPEIRVEGLAVRLERTDAGFNFSPLIERIQELTASDDSTPPITDEEPAPDDPSDGAPGRTIVIERVVLADWTLALDLGDTLKLPPTGLDTLVLENVRTDGQGLPGIMGQIAEQLFAYVQTEGLGAIGLDGISPELLAQIDGLRDKLGQDLPNLDELRAKLDGQLDEKVDELEADLNDKLNEVTGDVAGELEDLLNQATGGAELPPAAAEKLNELLEQTEGKVEIPADLRQKASELLENLGSESDLDQKAKELQEKAKEKLGGLGGLLGGDN